MVAMFILFILGSITFSCFLYFLIATDDVFLCLLFLLLFLIISMIFVYKQKDCTDKVEINAKKEAFQEYSKDYLLNKIDYRVEGYYQDSIFVPTDTVFFYKPIK